MAIVEAASDGICAYVAVLRVEHRQLRFLRRTHAAFWIENNDARVRNRVESMGNGAAGVSRGGGQHGERLIAAIERGEQPRHRSRTHILERERRPVKQLEREN